MKKNNQSQQVKPLSTDRQKDKCRNINPADKGGKAGLEDSQSHSNQLVNTSPADTNTPKGVILMGSATALNEILNKDKPIFDVSDIEKKILNKLLKGLIEEDKEEGLSIEYIIKRTIIDLNQLLAQKVKDVLDAWYSNIHGNQIFDKQIEELKQKLGIK